MSLLKKTDPQTGKERVSGARCKDVLTGMRRLRQGRFLSILPCLYNDWMFISLSLLFYWSQISESYYLYSLFSMTSGFTWKFSFVEPGHFFFLFVLNINDDHDNNVCKIPTAMNALCFLYKNILLRKVNKRGTFQKVSFRWQRQCVYVPFRSVTLALVRFACLSSFVAMWAKFQNYVISFKTTAHAFEF